MKTKLTVLVATIILSANVSWGQQVRTPITITETHQTAVAKSNRAGRVTNQLDYTILIKNGESVKDVQEYITSSLSVYTYTAHFSQVPGFLSVRIDKVYGEKWSGSFLYSYYADLTLTADSNATAGRYKPIIIFNFYLGGSLSETDTLDLDVTIYNRPPDKPQLASPGNNQLNQHKNIVLRWNEATTAKSYVVQLSADQFFTSVLKADTTSADTTAVTALAAARKYYWRVQASNSAGASDWSDTWSFTTGVEWEKTSASSSYEIKCFAWNGIDLFAGTDGGGILHSTDNGMNWNPVNNGLTDLQVDGILVSGNNLFAGTYNSGIFLSTNNGSSWTLIRSMYYVNTFAKIGSNLFVGNSQGVYLSKDDGKNWSDVTWHATVNPNSIIDFATIGNNLYAGAEGIGIYLSTDFGTTWSKVNSNWIECLATVSTRIFAGCNLMQGIIRSTDSGASWTTVNTGLTSKYSFDLAASGSNLFTLHSYDILLSTNYGDNWTSVDLGFTNSYRRKMLVTVDYLFVGTSNDGIWRRRLIEMTGVNLPAKPQPISAVVSQTRSTDTVVFKWNSVKDATLYLLQLSKDLSFTSLINKDSTTTDTTITITALSQNQNYYWRVRAQNEAGVGEWSDVWNFTLAGASSVEKVGDDLPKEYRLAQNFPNPFNPTTVIELSLPKPGYVSLTIFNSMGQVVQTIIDQQMAAGRYRAQWNAVNAASGVYFYCLKAGDASAGSARGFVETKKMILVR